MQESESCVQNEAVIVKRIQSRCRGLLEVTRCQEDDDDGRRIVQFMHQSMKDLLVAGKWFEILDPGSETTQV